MDKMDRTAEGRRSKRKPSMKQDSRLFDLEKLVKNRKGPFFIIPACLCGARRQANLGSESVLDLTQGSGQVPQLSILKELQETWTPFFSRVTAFYKTINLEMIRPHPSTMDKDESITRR
jgi:hypothetical protein